MTDWFRSWHGAPTDPKWRLIAKRAGARPGEVWSVISYLWDRASQAEDRGSIGGYDPELIAEVFGYETDDVARIIEALGEKRVIDGGRIAAWDKYQPRREDGSAARAKEWRERKKEEHERTRTHENAPERPEQIQSREDTEAASQLTDARPKPERLSRLLFEAAGISGFRDERHPKLQDLSPVYGLIDAGYNLHRDILPIVAERARNQTFSSWRFFEKAVVESAARNDAIPPAPKAAPVDWAGRLAVFNESGTWAHAWGPKPGESGCQAPAELVSQAA